MEKLSKIKILFAEDLPADAEMARRELKKEHIDFDALVVDTESDFVDALKTFGPHIVISDYSMPEFDGMSALKITRALPDYIPFIVLTGSMNEETAVKCMKAGANDYVIKEQIKRLPFAVKEAIENKRSRDEKIQMQERLQQTMEEYRDLINGMAETVWIISPDGKLLDVNASAVRVLGFSREELLESGLSGIDKHLSQADIDNLAGAMLRDKRQFFKTIHTCKDGTEIPVEINSTLVSYQGKPALLSVARDISDRHKAEKIRQFLYDISQLSMSSMSLSQYLQAIHKGLQKIMKAENLYIALYDQKTGMYTFPYHVDEYEDFTTDDPVSLENTLTDYVRRTGQAQLINEEKEAEIKKTENIELVGEPSPVWIGAPLMDSSKARVIGVIALQDYKNADAYTQADLHTLQIIANNIGIFIERIKNLEQIEISESRFKSFLNSTSDMTQLEDENYRMLFVNDSQLQLMGLSNNEEAVGKTVFELLPPEVAQYCNLSDRRARESGQIVKTEESWDDKTFETLKFPVDLGGGKTGVGAFIRDITEKKKMLIDLVAAKEKAEESDRLKSAFLANMSHEIRTPMNSMVGFLSLLDSPDLTEAQRSSYIDIVNRSSDRLLNTINDIIELSKIESGNLEISTEPVEMAELVNYYHDLFMPQAAEKNLLLKFDCPAANNGFMLVTDKTKLDSILTNLIKNAIKFTSEGEVRFSCQVQHDLMRFEVSDTGPGIPAHRLDAIFGRFVQADLEITRPHEGSGLGLAIAREYARLLGGEIQVSSEQGRGSTFSFSLPLRENPEHEQPADAEKANHAGENTSGSNSLILVAEDDPDSFAFLEAVLSHRNYRLIRASNGEEAVEMFRSQHDIDLVLMDIKMPVMDGYEATRQIRKIDPSVPIIAQTAYALTGDRQKVYDAGCTGYLS